MKSIYSGPILSTGLPDEFGDLLTYSRSLAFDQFPDYGFLTRSIKNLVEKMGYFDDNGPLDWTPCTHEFRNIIFNEPEILMRDEDEDELQSRVADYLNYIGKDSYFGKVIGSWERQGERDKDVTLPMKQLDNIIAPIVEVHTACRRPLI